jgi:hypothetical protein
VPQVDHATLDRLSVSRPGLFHHLLGAINARDTPRWCRLGQELDANPGRKSYLLASDCVVYEARW